MFKNISPILPHSHGHGPHGHTHEQLDHPGHYHLREKPLQRDFTQRAFTVGIGGPVGSGKTALMLQLCRRLRETYNIAAVTNDIFTKEDGEFLIRNQALAAERIRAVETGGCPHAAIREDITANLVALEELHAAFTPEILLIESGGDKVPRKGGPGITQSDLLVINKIDLAPHVGADLAVMDRDARKMRGDGPTVFAKVKHGGGVDEIIALILAARQTMVG